MNKGEPGTLSCGISDITKQVTVVWKEGNTVITSQLNVYTVDAGTINGDKQTSTLKVHNVQEDRTFSCSVTSGEYTDSGTFETDAKIMMFIQGKSHLW